MCGSFYILPALTAKAQGNHIIISWRNRDCANPIRGDIEIATHACFAKKILIDFKC